MFSDTDLHGLNKKTICLVHYVLVEFPEWLGTDARVDLNYLTEKHGKNQRDTHFRAVRSYTLRAARESKTTIGTCSMLKDALTRSHAAVQAFNRGEGAPLQSCEFYLLNLPAKGTYTKKMLQVSDLCTIYAMRFEEDCLYAYTDSTFTHRVEISYCRKSIKTTYETIIPPSKPAPTPVQLTAILLRLALSCASFQRGPPKPPFGPNVGSRRVLVSPQDPSTPTPSHLRDPQNGPKIGPQDRKRVVLG